MSSFLKTVIDGAVRTFFGRSFHSAGPANEKARSANLLVDPVVAKSPRDAERKPFLAGIELQSVTSDDM